MILGVNLCYLRPGGVGGSETYVREVLGELSASAGIDVILFCRADVGSTLRGLGQVCPIGAGSYSPLNRVYGEAYLLPTAARRQRVDVLLSPANFCVPRPGLEIPQVVTIHDLQHNHLPENFSRWKSLARTQLFKTTFSVASKIIAISEATKADVMAFYGVAEHRISVVRQGVTTLSYSATEASDWGDRGIHRPFFIYPAMLAPHKNHRFLLDVFRRFLSASGAHVQLVLTGQRLGRPDGFKDLIQEFDLVGDVVDLGYIDRSEMIGLLREAKALVFPSLFEGFGLPILEAMQLKTPVISSSAGALPEVVGESGVLLSPTDATGWVSAFIKICTVPQLTQDLVRAGSRHAAGFTWRFCAEETLKVLRQAMEDSCAEG